MCVTAILSHFTISIGWYIKKNISDRMVRKAAGSGILPKKKQFTYLSLPCSAWIKTCSGCIRFPGSHSDMNTQMTPCVLTCLSFRSLPAFKLASRPIKFFWVLEKLLQLCSLAKSQTVGSWSRAGLVDQTHWWLADLHKAMVGKLK